MSDRDDNEEQEGGGSRPGLPIDPLRLWHALRDGWQIIAVITIIGAFIGAAIAKKMVSQTFSARAVMRWEQPMGQIDQVLRNTMVESVTLPSNLEVVKKKLKLEMPAVALNNSITVLSSQNSNHISVDGTWSTPDGAANLANTVMDTFLKAREQAERARMNAEIARYRQAVADAEKRQLAAAEAYEKFRKANGISDIDAERQKVIEVVANLSAQKDAAAAEAAVARKELETLGKEDPAAADAPALSRVMNEAEAAQADADRKRLPQLRAEINTARVQYSDEHPVMRRLLAEQEALQKRIAARGESGASTVRKASNAKEKAEQALVREKKSAELAAQFKERLDKLSSVEGQAAVLLGEMTVAETALQETKGLLTAAELGAAKPPPEFTVLERATPPEIAASSPRKRVAIGVPAGFLLLSVLGVIIWNLRKLDVLTPKEAAFWANVPVIGASTWPRDPDMLSSLMHDLDDFAPQAEGVTLIVGVSPDEAALARRVAEWDGHRMPKAYDAQKLLPAGAGSDAHALAIRDGEPVRGDDASNMQILTLTGPVPAQALRRAGRMADRVLVVVTSGKHSLLQLMKIRNRLGREGGIGILLVGLKKDYAMVRDRVGEVERFWHATRIAGQS